MRKVSSTFASVNPNHLLHQIRAWAAGERGGELNDRPIFPLQAFLLEPGHGFCFVGRRYRLALGRQG